MLAEEFGGYPDEAARGFAGRGQSP